MPSPSVSQCTGFVPRASSSRSVRPSLSVSRFARSSSLPAAGTVGLNAAAMSSEEIGTPFAMSASWNLSPSRRFHSPLSSIQPTVARYQRKYSKPSGKPSPSVSSIVGSVRFSGIQEASLFKPSFQFATCSAFVASNGHANSWMLSFLFMYTIAFDSAGENDGSETHAPRTL